MSERESDRSLYELLGVSETVTAQEIRTLRRELARRYHPDVAAQPDPARLGRVLSACDVLCDPVRRSRYDARREREAPQRREREAPQRREREAAERREREAAEERERAAAARRAQRSPDGRRRADFSAALRGEAAWGGARSARGGLRMAGLTAARLRRAPGFDWDGAVTRAVCYALGAATVPGYVSAFVVGGWLTPASTFESDPHPVLLNGPILIVLGVQAVLAACLSLLVDVRAWRRRLRAPGPIAADGS